MSTGSGSQLRGKLSFIAFITAISLLIFTVACGGVSASSNTGGGNGTGSPVPTGSGGPGGTGSGNSNNNGGTPTGGNGGGTTPGGGSTDGGGSGITAPTYVYVTSGKGQIAAYAIAGDGTATPVSGSPFSARGKVIAADPQGRFLFGADDNNVSTFSIAADGALSQVSNFTVTTGAPSSYLNTDLSGTSLYFSQLAFQANSYLEFAVGGNGALQQIGTTEQRMFWGSELTFAHDNVHAYNHGCQVTAQVVNTLVRQSNGTLTDGTAGIETYSDASAYWYCPVGISASPTLNVVAVAFAGNGGVVGVYSIGSDGGGTAIGTPLRLPSYMNEGTSRVLQVAWDPSGNYVFVGTSSGVQVYSFNSVSGLAAVGQLQAPAGPTFIQVDKQGHLIGMNGDWTKLLVYNFNNGTLTAAPGSPVSLPFVGAGIAAVPQTSTTLGTGS